MDQEPGRGLLAAIARSAPGLCQVHGFLRPGGRTLQTAQPLAPCLLILSEPGGSLVGKGQQVLVQPAGQDGVYQLLLRFLYGPDAQLQAVGLRGLCSAGGAAYSPQAGQLLSNAVMDHALQVFGVDSHARPGAGALVGFSGAVKVPPDLACLVGLALDCGHGVAAAGAVHLAGQPAGAVAEAVSQLLVSFQLLLAFQPDVRLYQTWMGQMTGAPASYPTSPDWPGYAWCGRRGARRTLR